MTYFELCIRVVGTASTDGFVIYSHITNISYWLNYVTECLHNGVFQEEKLGT